MIKIVLASGKNDIRCMDTLKDSIHQIQINPFDSNLLTLGLKATLSYIIKLYEVLNKERFPSCRS